jgi:prepilin-type processing-associated H-X9-DG protein
MKQCGTAALTYTQDYDETLPMGWYEDLTLPPAQQQGHWQIVLRPYLGEGKGKEVWDLSGASIRTCPSAVDNRQWAYSYNTWAGDQGRTITQADIKNISEMVWFGDATQIPKWGNASSATFYAFNNSIEDRAGKLDRDADDCIGMVRYRHNGGAEIVFTDGHVKFTKRATLTVDKNWKASPDQQ